MLSILLAVNKSCANFHQHIHQAPEIIKISLNIVFRGLSNNFVSPNTWGINPPFKFKSFSEPIYP